MTIFKACDVRGVVGREWDSRDARQIGRSLGKMLKRRRQTEMVVGGDFRRSTPQLKEALVDGLCDTGIAVHDVGLAPTPVVQFAARHIGCRSVAIVTASHNPGKYNGIKFLIDGWPPVPEMIQELKDGRSDAPSATKPGQEHPCTVIRDYQRWVVTASRSFVDDRLGLREANQSDTQRRVLIDTMGGAFTGLAPQVLSAAGYDVLSLDDQLDPDFVRRDPNPAVDANLQGLVDTIQQTGADLGMALDGDGDRVIFLDEHGVIARPEQIAAILLRHCLGASTVIYDLKCASIVARTAEALGGVAVMQPSGHGFIKRKLLELAAELGVEVSGHHFFGVLEGGDDGLFTALVLLQLLDRSSARLSDWLAEIDWPAITPDLRIPFRGDPSSVLESIASTCGGHVHRMDGVRAEYEDNGWALARASITEPAITFRFEGRDQQHVREIVTRFLADHTDLCQLVMEKMR